MVTGGLGCAPVTGALEYIFRRRTNYGRVSIMLGVKKATDLIHNDRFELWRREPNTRVLLTSDQPDRAWHHRLGVVTELFEEVEMDAKRTVAFLCGPEIMMHYAIRILHKRGLPEDRIFLSMERNMKCAVGLCGHCQFGPEFVCKDGPIFPFQRIAPYFGVRGL